MLLVLRFFKMANKRLLILFIPFVFFLFKSQNVNGQINEEFKIYQLDSIKIYTQADSLFTLYKNFHENYFAQRNSLTRRKFLNKNRSFFNDIFRINAVIYGEYSHEGLFNPPEHYFDMYSYWYNQVFISNLKKFKGGRIKKNINLDRLSSMYEINGQNKKKYLSVYFYSYIQRNDNSIDTIYREMSFQVLKNITTNDYILKIVKVANKVPDEKKIKYQLPYLVDRLTADIDKNHRPTKLNYSFRRPITGESTIRYFLINKVLISYTMKCYSKL